MNVKRLWTNGSTPASKCLLLVSETMFTWTFSLDWVNQALCPGSAPSSLAPPPLLLWACVQSRAFASTDSCAHTLTRHHIRGGRAAHSQVARWRPLSDDLFHTKSVGRFLGDASGLLCLALVCHLLSAAVGHVSIHLSLIYGLWSDSSSSRGIHMTFSNVWTWFCRHSFGPGPAD